MVWVGSGRDLSPVTGREARKPHKRFPKRRDRSRRNRRVINQPTRLFPFFGQPLFSPPCVGCFQCREATPKEAAEGGAERAIANGG